MSDLLDFLKTNRPELPEEDVHVPEWDRTLTLRGWTARERDKFEERQLQLNTALAKASGQPQAVALDNARARLVAHTIWENGGRPLATPEGERLLGNMPAKVIEPLIEAARRVNGISREDIEELAKNSDATRDGDSSSASPSLSGEPSLN